MARRIRGLAILRSEARSSNGNECRSGVHWRMTVEDACCKLKAVY